ncbi:SUN domain-containing protein 1 [Vitis vinifera]|uniref:SUN domain-containing protein 1 n=1 Tax=Vitis vinifera TaxID=29760 RepID=A0A438EBK5_VITVI|nr:SUN domain-containing protein 1 [Vitis vinifera]
MSASTVSITANTAARRRPVVIGEKKPNIELLSGDAGVSQFNGIAGEDKLTGGGGKDLSHSIRGETFLRDRKRWCRSRKRPPTPPPSLAVPRKVVSKSERPRWVTAVSIFTKNLVLLVVILGLVQMIRKLALKSADSSGGSLVAVPDFERRIAEVESFLKTTTKMMQVQVEVVDRKIESEVGGLRRELSKKIEEKAGDFNNHLEKLDSKSETLEKKLGEEMSLDEIRGIAREIVEKEIERHAADGLGRVDYALSSSGAWLLGIQNHIFFGKGSGWFPKTSLTGVHRDSERMLKPSFGEPGQCFPLKGDSGFVQIRLRTTIIPEAITLEHVDKVMFLLFYVMTLAILFVWYLLFTNC